MAFSGIKNLISSVILCAFSCESHTIILGQPDTFFFRSIVPFIQCANIKLSADPVGFGKDIFCPILGGFAL